jgi:hypothetical protein
MALVTRMTTLMLSWVVMLLVTMTIIDSRLVGSKAAMLGRFYDASTAQHTIVICSYENVPEDTSYKVGIMCFVDDTRAHVSLFNKMHSIGGSREMSECWKSCLRCAAFTHSGMLEGQSATMSAIYRQPVHSFNPRQNTTDIVVHL